MPSVITAGTGRGRTTGRRHTPIATTCGWCSGGNRYSSGSGTGRSTWRVGGRSTSAQSRWRVSARRHCGGPGPANGRLGPDASPGSPAAVFLYAVQPLADQGAEEGRLLDLQVVTGAVEDDVRRPRVVRQQRELLGETGGGVLSAGQDQRRAVEGGTRLRDRGCELPVLADALHRLQVGNLQARGDLGLVPAECLVRLDDGDTGVVVRLLGREPVEEARFGDQYFVLGDVAFGVLQLGADRADQRQTEDLGGTGGDDAARQVAAVRLAGEQEGLVAELGVDEAEQSGQVVVRGRDVAGGRLAHAGQVGVEPAVAGAVLEDRLEAAGHQAVVRGPPVNGEQGCAVAVCDVVKGGHSPKRARPHRQVVIRRGRSCGRRAAT